MIQIALAGNPNTGKTTLFNRLTGLRQKVANYPGVTVELRRGTSQISGQDSEIIDLPGTYSLVARSRDEAVAVEALTGLSPGVEPQVVVIVLDGTNLLRNLYFALSVMELGIPSVVALNMMDEARARGISIDSAALSKRLGVPVVETTARTGEGINELIHAAHTVAKTTSLPMPRSWRLEPASEALVQKVQQQLPQEQSSDGLALWLLSTGTTVLLANEQYLEIESLVHPRLQTALAMATAELKTLATNLGETIIEKRYEYAREIVQATVAESRSQKNNLSDRIDAILLHPILGFMTFILAMALLFQGVFAWSDPFMTLVEDSIVGIQNLIYTVIPKGAIADLLADGVVGGVGNILVFLPQIAILFAFIAILEDTGYLARAAFLSDQLMARVGLHGRAFIPLLSGFACAVPAIMAARPIENPKDRLVTILVAPLISCSARLPIYTLLIGTLFASEQTVFGIISVGGLMLLSFYIASTIATIVVAFVLKRTILAGPTPPLVIELPPYRIPQWSSILQRVYERCKIFVSEAGSVILVCSMVLWALLYFPNQVPENFNLEAKKSAIVQAIPEGPEQQLAIANLNSQAHAEKVRQSYAGILGRTLEPVFAPLGYDWQMVVGIIGSFAAREVFVSTLGLVYGVSHDNSEDNLSLREKLRSATRPDTQEPTYTPLVGLSLMIFFMFALQCMSTVAVIRRETHSWNWALFAVGYAGVLAWTSAFIVYQSGRLLGFS